MRRFLAVLLLAGCSSEVRRYDRDPVGPEMAPVPPDHILRIHPDFRFLDYVDGKEYFLRFYSDENFQEEIVTVRDPGQAERGATVAEREYALSVFATDWKLKSDEDRLRYHAELYENEKKLNATLLDLMVENEQGGLRRFRERYDAILFNLRARKDTGVHPKEGDELSTKFHEPSTEFLEQELAQVDLLIKAAEARLKMLEYKRAARNARFSRSSAAQFRRDAIQVADVVKVIPGDRLIELVKQNVDPDSWKRTLARIESQGEFLVVTQTADNIDRVRAYVDQLRIEVRRAPAK